MEPPQDPPVRPEQAPLPRLAALPPTEERPRYLPDVDYWLRKLREAHGRPPSRQRDADIAEALDVLRTVGRDLERDEARVRNARHLALRLRWELYDAAQPGTDQPLGYSLDLVDLYAFSLDWEGIGGRNDWDRSEAPKAVVTLFRRLPSGPADDEDWDWESPYGRLSNALGSIPGGAAIPAIEWRRRATGGSRDAENEDFWLHIAHVEALRGLSFEDPQVRDRARAAALRLQERVTALEKSLPEGRWSLKVERGRSALSALPDEVRPPSPEEPPRE